ncbi:UDP-2,3-diacylglucosamine diphosphatase [Shewanella sp.]|uniref:UDP-2,3-diacylglucosamine diphosphatase n=1 Tax=Shewanella sp. TaxID=50422 RepID=UPI004053E4DB
MTQAIHSSIEQHTAFVGDLHLSADRPDISHAFLDFLNHGLDNVEALYVLGDLFEVWMGDDIAEPFSLEIARALQQVSQRMPVYFTQGNRDFLLGKHFCQLAGMTPLADVHRTTLYGISTVILHGDSLCTLDEAYQKFRRFRSIKLVRWLYTHLPKPQRLKIAQNIRNKSKQDNQYKSTEIMDVEPQAVDALLEQTQSTRMIHGHTHRPAIHQLANNRQRLVVGDWYEQGSILRIGPSLCELSSLPL